MKAMPLAVVVAFLPLIVSCATPYNEAPLATNFPTTKQPKLQAAAHWNVIAKDVAQHLSAYLKVKDAPPLFVNEASNKTAFDRAFTNQLISALVAAGYAVTKLPSDALIVDVDIQVVRFSANRPQYRHTGLATALATGVWALHAAEATAGAVLVTGVASADAYTWFSSEFASGATPQTEIIITTSVSDLTRYVARSTNVYYLADSDSKLYINEPPLPPPFQVKTKNMGVTGQ